jgi:hypothetical protein
VDGIGEQDRQVGQGRAGRVREGEHGVPGQVIGTWYLVLRPDLRHRPGELIDDGFGILGRIFIELFTTSEWMPER